MSKNQFITEANRYLDAIEGNFKEITLKEKRRKIRNVANNFYVLYTSRAISTSNPRKITHSDINTYVAKRRKDGIKDTTIRKELSLINGLLWFLGNDQMMVYRSIYGRNIPGSYEGRQDPIPNDVIEKVYELARTTDDWSVMEGCMAIVLGVSAGLRPQESRMLYASNVHHHDERPYIYLVHVKGEGKWGRPRNVPIVDPVIDIYDKFFRMREIRLGMFGIKTDSMFPSFRTGREFISQQSLSKLKHEAERLVGGNFMLRAGRRSFGQRLIDREVELSKVSVCMGHMTTKTTERFYGRVKDIKAMDEALEKSGIIQLSVQNAQVPTEPKEVPKDGDIQ